MCIYIQFCHLLKTQVNLYANEIDICVYFCILAEYLILWDIQHLQCFSEFTDILIINVENTALNNYTDTLAEGHLGPFQNYCSILISKQNSLDSNFKNKTL